MPDEADAYPGQNGTYAYADTEVTITPSDLSAIFEKGQGGFGWAGHLELSCESGHSPATLDSDDDRVLCWAPTAIGFLIPKVAPCLEGADSWQIRIVVGSSSVESSTIEVASSEEDWIATPVSIKGPPDSGYPPIRG